MDFPKSFFKTIDKFSLLLLPIVFISSGFVNIFLYYFGIHQNDSLRRSISITILILIFIVSLLKLITIIKENNDKKKKIIFVLGLMVGYILMYGGAMLRFDNEVGIGKTFLIWGIYSVPAAIFAMDIAFNNREKILFRGMKYCSMILLPAAVIYVVLMLFNINKYTNGVYLGKIDYMSLGYTHMIPMFFLLLGIFFEEKNSIINITGDNIFCNQKVERYVIFSTIILFWILMIFTGLRGGLISTVWFFMCTLFFLIKNNYDKNSLSKILVTFFSLWLFFNFIYTPTGLQNSVSRVKSMGVGIEKKSFSEVDKASYSWVMSEEEAIEVRTFKYHKSRVEVDQAWLKLAQKNDKIQNYFEIAGGVIPFFNRAMLYDFAWYEFSRNPFKGIGAFSYTVKYRTYPHNILLEILCEWGIIIFILYVVGVLILLRKLYNSNNSDVQIMFLFFVGSIPTLMISGSIYTSYLHIIFIVYASCMGKNILKE